MSHAAEGGIRGSSTPGAEEADDLNVSNRLAGQGFRQEVR